VRRAVTASLYCRQQQYITVKRLDGGAADTTVTPTMRPSETECLMVSSVEALHALSPEFPPLFRDSIAELATRVARGCVVCLARRPRADGAGTVVGYEIAERGTFSALGRRHVVGDHVVFSHYAEVLPAYRGQRIHGLMFSTRDAYFRERGARLVCGVCLPHNQASLRALRRDGATVVGTVERVVVLRSFVIWTTPFERIARALERAGYDISVSAVPTPRASHRRENTGQSSTSSEMSGANVPSVSRPVQI
jgi:GNAT superfamily N-acetyltransferase